ncbi:2-hydroxymuconic semialdehyde hydrolase [Pediococcus acidilactici]|uniref:2-hydroxymuconic semialdehyde hydrolase n=1 Tax=Pediococcus acidilactici TaxID=1254 RepID=UPI001058B175|nr:2-hydroxymuconic semialdehyde hydrolase [Pediococcus acidilactici]KAF0517152.1 2-hydroxymuconic semialdehyde hydrolase [Pediococcus acidilactici]MCT3036384.1 2-hydroxymuconic semialdehyde hydrolase [Pediococcus acidilactici]QQC46455.1 2-hydroxymuconic semialdehyde hydrolase [Pediococcus acidilactici]
MDKEKYIHEINDIEDLDYIPEYQYMLSTFPAQKNISVSNLKHLFKGLPIVDTSDEEYVHWIQLDDEALEYINSIIH